MATRILVLVTKNENVGAGWPQDSFSESRALRLNKQHHWKVLYSSFHLNGHKLKS